MVTTRKSPLAAAPASAVDPLARYWAKRDFAVTAEPRGETTAPGDRLSFVVQKHAASRLHYDFRLELGGVLVSWAVPKGPSFDPADKRMAIHVEDHPLSYGKFEGTIPPKQYGAGTVIVWDHGQWEPVGDPVQGLANGKLLFKLHGQKLFGLWELVKIAKGGERQAPWILFKRRDGFARPKGEYDVVSALPDSVIAKPLVQRPEQALAGAVEAPLPDSIAPQLATLATGIPATGTWTYEVKFDGYRVAARIEDGKPRLITRGGHDWSAKMPQLLAELEQMKLGTAWLDGEVVVLNAQGLPDFNALQKAFDGRSTAELVYFVFDLPYFEGYDLRALPLEQRRELLKAVVDDKGTAHVRFSVDFAAEPGAMLASACKMNLEGVIAKRADAPYVSRRSETWLKLKCKQRQEFVVCGYTDRSNEPTQIGSLLLGVHDAQGRLVSVGSVGTGWSASDAQALKDTLQKIELPAAPYAQGPATPGRWSRRLPGSEKWVKPELVAEVEFAEWTPQGQIRHATFVSLRSDKEAQTITREIAQDMASTPPQRRAGPATVGNIQVSHGERVVDPSSGITKLDLVRYYVSIADWILPYLKGRPCSLVRGPTGITGPLFFQKHGEKIGIPGIRDLDPALWPGHEALLEVGTPQALAGAAQMNVIEFHTWNAKAKNIDRPDRMIFDLDPGEGTAWPQVQEAAELVRVLLTELKLKSWLKTSGGKGLHVVVPLAPRLDYESVHGFSQAIVQHLAKTIPSRFVAKSGPANRIGKIFVDYLRNGHGATTAAAFSARARPGLGVSMPVSWDDLPQLKSGAQWTVATAREHVSFQRTDPWQDYGTSRQSLGGPMKALGFKPKATE